MSELKRFQPEKSSTTFTCSDGKRYSFPNDGREFVLATDAEAAIAEARREAREEAAQVLWNEVVLIENQSGWRECDAEILSKLRILATRINAPSRRRDHERLAH